MNAKESARLAKFAAGTSIKQYVRPGLHVRPLVAELFITENCNLRCISCNCWREVTRGELTTDEWKDVLGQLVELRIHKVNFTGGEPLIRKDAIELMAHAHGLGIRHMHLNTNAIRLTAGRRQAVLAAGVRSFNISVDGPTAASHDEIRGKAGAFATTIRHLQELIAERDRYRLKLRMNFTVMRNNVGLLPDIARLAQRLRVRLYLNLATDHTFLFRAEGVDRLAEIPGDEISAAVDEVEALAHADGRFLPRYSDLEYVRHHFREPMQRSVPCAESLVKLMIHSRGEIGGCWGHDPHRNVREQPIAELIDSHEYREEHSRLFAKDCVGCGANYSFNLRLQPASYVRDLRRRFARPIRAS